MSIKQLPPSQRKNYRYLKFKVHSDEKVNIGRVVDAIWDSALKLLGTKEVAEADFWFLGNEYDKDQQEGIIKVKRDKEESLRACLTLITNFSGQEGFIEVTKTSGSLKNLN